MTTTRATITIEIEVPVSGTWVPAEPDVGINEGWFEDAQIDWVGTLGKIMDAASEAYADAIQDALSEAAHDDRDDDGDARYEAMKDRLID